MAALFFDALAEHRSCQEMLREHSEMKKRLTCRSLMGYETLMPLMLQWLLDTFGGDARASGAISLKMHGWKAHQPQKARFPGRD